MDTKIKRIALIAGIVVVLVVAYSSFKTVTRMMRQNDEEVADMELYEATTSDDSEVSTATEDDLYDDSGLYDEDEDEDEEESALETTEEYKDRHWNEQVQTADDEETLVYTVNGESVTYPLEGLPDTWENIQDEAYTKRWVAEDGSLIKSLYDKDGKCGKVIYVLNGASTSVLGLYRSENSAFVTEEMKAIGATSLTVDKEGSSDLYEYGHYFLAFDYNNGLATISITDKNVDLTSEVENQGDKGSVQEPIDVSSIDPQLSDDAPVGDFPEDGVVLSAEEWEKIKENYPDGN